MNVDICLHDDEYGIAYDNDWMDGNVSSSFSSTWRTW